MILCGSLPARGLPGNISGAINIIAAIGEPHLPVEANPLILSAEQLFSESADAINERRSGACICFAHPDQTALDAYVFWSVETYQRVVSAYVRPHKNIGFGGVISLDDFQCRKMLLKSFDGEQHLLLADRRRVVQVRCIGEDIRVDPFGLEPVVEGFPSIESPQRLIRTLANLYRNRSFTIPHSGWTVEGMRHRDALAALDKRREGYSYREIAIFLYDENAVQTDWRDPNQTMKNRVIRSVKRGHRMMDRGYRKLLK